MTDDFRDIESELESLRPVEPSPALRWKVAGELEGGPRRGMRRLVIASGSVAAAAACVVVAVVLWQTGVIRTGFHVKVVNVYPPTAPTTRVVVSPRPDRPALGVYAAALSGSPDALDQLLDRQGASLGAPAGPSRPWGATTELTN